MLLYVYKSVLCVLPFLWLRPLVLCAIKYIPPSHCIFFLDILLFNGLQGWVQNRISFLASFCFPSWFQAAVFWWLPIRHRLPWSVSDQNCRGKNKSPFICFFFSFCCFFWLALWLYFKLTNTHIHGPLHIYFALTSFCVNFRCRRGLNMAVITGYYESHVSVALLPNVNDWRHRNFHDYHKKKKNNPKRREEVWMCTYVHNWVCMQCRFTV